MYPSKAFLKCRTFTYHHQWSKWSMMVRLSSLSITLHVVSYLEVRVISTDAVKCNEHSKYTIQPTERSENRQKSKPNWKRDQRKAKLQLNCLDLVILILLFLPFKEHVMKISWRWMVRWARQLLEQGGRGEGRRAKGGDWRGLKKTSLEKLVICPIKIRAWFRGS